MQDARSNPFVSLEEKARRRKLGAAFEEEVASAYECAGFAVDRRGLKRRGRKGDGGIDLLVWQPDRPLERTAIQCKARRSGEVGVDEVQRMIGIVHTEHAVVRGAVVTTATFSQAAMNLAAKGGQIELIDGPTLMSRWGIDGVALHSRFPRAEHIAVHRPVAVTVTLPESVVADRSIRHEPPATHPRARPSRRLAWIGGALAVLLCISYLVTRQLAPPVADPLVAAPTTPGANPLPAPAPVRSPDLNAKPPQPHRPAVVKRPVAQRPTEAQVPAPLPQQLAEPAVIYKSADMTDAEFEAWKQRKAQREQQPAATVEADESRPDTTHESNVSPETMQTILRTNHR
jgi:hypothetical protein